MPTNKNKRKVEIDDLYRFRLLSDPQASPDGRMVAYVQTRLRKKKNDYASNIWLVPTDGSSEAVKFTTSKNRDMLPRWSPQGDEIAFLSTRSGKPQIWVIPVRGGEARQLTFDKRGVGEFAWSPDGKWIVFNAAVDNELDKKFAEAEKKGDKKEENIPDDSENKEPGVAGQSGMALPSKPPGAGEWPEDQEEDEGGEDKGDHAKVFTRLQVREDGEGFVERRAHLFIVPGKGGKAEQLTEGDYDATTPRWSPDGKSLAFLSMQGPDADYHNIQDVFVMPISKDGKPGKQRRVSKHNCAIMGMDWLPSGDGFALFAHSRTQEAALGTNIEVWTMTLQGITHNLTEGFDRTAGGWMSSDMRTSTGEFRPRFSRDGTLIYFTVTNEGAVEIYSVPVRGGAAKQVIGGEREILNFCVAANGIVFAASTALNPNDLYRIGFDGKNERQLTNINQDILGELELSEPRGFWITRPDSVKVQGWIMLPTDYKKGKKYPLVVEVHGGPHFSYGGVYFHEFQMQAARGCIVLYTNPRGSQGYGQVFSDAIINDWGGVDYDDIMACVDYAIEQGNVDESRLGIGGGSYGGFMSTWAIGHTQRFKAAVASRMVSNLYSEWGAGDFTWMLLSWELEDTPQKRTQLYLDRSPVTYVEQMHTPLLITHAVDDLRTGIEQSYQVYTALKLLKRDVKMVLFPSGGHDVSRTGKPSLRVERLGYILDWFDQYLKT